MIKHEKCIVVEGNQEDVASGIQDCTTFGGDLPQTVEVNHILL